MDEFAGRARRHSAEQLSAAAAARRTAALPHCREARIAADAGDHRPSCCPPHPRCRHGGSGALGASPATWHHRVRARPQRRDSPRRR
eukprot:SAG25_NODE_134_length_14400_cov_805.311049_14_plen_87_part_00